MDFHEFYEITDQLKTLFDILQIGMFLITSQFQKYLIFLGFFITLLFYQIEPLKNGASLILPSSIARNSSAPNAKRIFEIL